MRTSEANGLGIYKNLRITIINNFIFVFATLWFLFSYSYYSFVAAPRFAERNGRQRNMPV